MTYQEFLTFCIATAHRVQYLFGWSPDGWVLKEPANDR